MVRARATQRDFVGESGYLYTAAKSGAGREIAARVPGHPSAVGWRRIAARARSLRRWAGKGEGRVCRFGCEVAPPNHGRTAPNAPNRLTNVARVVELNRCAVVGSNVTGVGCWLLALGRCVSIFALRISRVWVSDCLRTATLAATDSPEAGP